MSNTRNFGDRCVIPEIALYYNGSGQHLLRASAPLRENILAQGFDRAWPRDGDNRRVPLHRLRRSPSPCWGGIISPSERGYLTDVQYKT